MTHRVSITMYNRRGSETLTDFIEAPTRADAVTQAIALRSAELEAVKSSFRGACRAKIQVLTYHDGRVA